MSQVLEINNQERQKAINFCIKNWGWETPPKEVVDRAIVTLRFMEKGLRVGDIITELKLMPASKLEKHIRERAEKKVVTPLIDYIIENDTDSRDFPEHKSNILAYKNGMQYFEDLGISGVRLHDDMNLDDIMKAAQKYKAVLLEIDAKTPALVFSGFNDEYQLYTSEGRVEQLNNPFKTNYPNLIIAVGNTTHVLAALNQDLNKFAKDTGGRELIHNALLRDDSIARRKLAKIHDYVIRNNGTDIHIDPSPFTTTVEVKARFDTILRPLPGDFFFTQEEYQQAKQYLTSQSGAVQNNAILQRPADGRYTYRLSDKTYDVRCAYIPTGQDVSFTDNQVFIRLRLLSQSSGAIDLKRMGVSPTAIKHMTRAVRAESGMSIMVGPTGSGKSTTLFGMVNEHYKIFGESKSRISIEDPVERKVPNINQMQVTDQIKRESENPFLVYLKFLLRFDPDFMVVGEMRDQETVEAGGNYANTGHLVLGTLHANDTIKAVERIVNMLKDQDLRRMIIECLHYIFSQRLVPMLCEHCKQVRDVPEDLYDDLVAHVKRNGNDPELIPRKAAFQSQNGCSNCDNTGFTSKKPVNEVLEITDEVKQLIFSDSPDRLIKLREHRAITLFSETLQLIIDQRASIKELFK
jgi:type II secretory ATPase GspE/PulE/Tfp pilus assembly ATPase PilB-like protein